MTDPLHKQLELARRDLLELSTANRLLNTKRDQERGSAVEIKDELSHHVFQVLVDHQATMDFEQGVVADADSDAATGTGRKRRTSKTTAKKAQDPVDAQTDNLLHTELEAEELDDRLMSLVTDADALFQEQGTNVLYLAMGFLKWHAPDDKTAFYHAPLVLVPVQL